MLIPPNPTSPAAHPDTRTKRARVAAAFRQATRCSNVAQVQAAVAQARASQPQRIVRCGGNLSASALAAFDASTDICLVLAGELAQVKRLGLQPDGNTSFWVGAGCLIGHDPTNPLSTPASSLMACAAAAGCALPLVGGSSNMTLGGYCMTGSDGGSTRHALADCITSIELVDGRGCLRTLLRGTDDFDAAGVSMGLFGIITGITLALMPAYRLQGSERTQRRIDSVLQDVASFRQTHAAHAYVHAYWFPNQGVDAVQSYVADRVAQSQPQQPYRHELQGTLKNVGYTLVMRAVNWAIYRHHPRIAASLLQLFARPKRHVKHFCDDWHVAGPNDDQVHITTRRGFESTEIWFDIDHAEAVLAACKTLFDSDPIACGHSGLQIFCAARSPFWLSPAYGAEQIRVDALWWPDCGDGSASDYFARFWNALLSIPSARLHWGKELPAAGPDWGLTSLASAYPRLHDWLALRAAYDPDQIFVSAFWRDIFSLTKAPA